MISWEETLYSTGQKEGIEAPGLAVSAYAQLIASASGILWKAMGDRSVSQDRIRYLAAVQAVGFISPSYQNGCINRLGNPEEKARFRKAFMLHGNEYMQITPEETAEASLRMHAGPDAAYIARSGCRINMHEHSEGDAVLGGREWAEARKAFIQRMAKVHPYKPSEKLSPERRKQVAGIIRIADSIVSAISPEEYGMKGISAAEDHAESFIEEYRHKGSSEIRKAGRYDRKLLALLDRSRPSHNGSIRICEGPVTERAIHAAVIHLRRMKLPKPVIAAFPSATAARLYDESEYTAITVDQVLSAAVGTGQADISTAMLAGTGLIISASGSYDQYSMKLLAEATKTLTALGTDIIIMATAIMPRDKAVLFGCSEGEVSSEAYPLLTCSSHRIVETPAEISSRKGIGFGFVRTDDEALKAVSEAVSYGKTVVLIRDTVRLAQDAYSALKQCCDPEAGIVLLHSRFTGYDREGKEADLKNAMESRKGLAVITTDSILGLSRIKADTVISDIAPMDILLTRMMLARRKAGKALVISPYPEVDGSEDFGEAGSMFPSYILHRTAEALSSASEITFSSFRMLISAAYADRAETGNLRKLKDIWKRNEQQRKARALYAENGMLGLLRHLSLTRGGAQKSTRLTLYRRIDLDKGDMVSPDGREISLKARGAAEAVRKSSLYVPLQDAPDIADEKMAGKLRKLGLGKFRRLAENLPDGRLMNTDGSGTGMEYTGELGYRRKRP